MSRRPFARTLTPVVLALAACTGGESSPVGIDLLPGDLLTGLRLVVSNRFERALDYEVFPGERFQAERLTTAHEWPTPDGFESRALFRFNVAALDSLPAGSEFGEPVLKLVYAVPTDDVEFAIHRVTSEWSEEGATWTQRDFGRAWVMPGGDFDPVPVTRFSILGAPPDTAAATTPIDSIQVSIPPELFDGWRSGQIAEHGLILLQGTPGTVVDFASRGIEGSNPLGPTIRIEVFLPDDISADLRLLAVEDVFLPRDGSPFAPGGLVVRGAEPPRRVVLQPIFEDLPAGATLAAFQLVMTVRDVDIPRDSLSIFAVPLLTEFRGEHTFLSPPSVLSPLAIVGPQAQPGDTVVFASAGFTSLARVWLARPATNHGLALRFPEAGAVSETVAFGGVQFYGMDAPPELRPRFRAVVVPASASEGE